MGQTLQNRSDIFRFSNCSSMTSSTYESNRARGFVRLKTQQKFSCAIARRSTEPGDVRAICHVDNAALPGMLLRQLSGCTQMKTLKKQAVENCQDLT